MNNLSPAFYLWIFLLGCAAQAGIVWYMSHENARRLRSFDEKLTTGLLDIAWIKGYMAKANGGKKR